MLVRGRSIGIVLGARIPATLACMLLGMLFKVVFLNLHTNWQVSETMKAIEQGREEESDLQQQKGTLITLIAKYQEKMQASETMRQDYLEQRHVLEQGVKSCQSYNWTGAIDVLFPLNPKEIP